MFHLIVNAWIDQIQTKFREWSRQYPCICTRVSKHLFVLDALVVPPSLRLWLGLFLHPTRPSRRAMSDSSRASFGILTMDFLDACLGVFDAGLILAVIGLPLPASFSCCCLMRKRIQDRDDHRICYGAATWLVLRGVVVYRRVSSLNRWQIVSYWHFHASLLSVIRVTGLVSNCAEMKVEAKTRTQRMIYWRMAFQKDSMMIVDASSFEATTFGHFEQWLENPNSVCSPRLRPTNGTLCFLLKTKATSPW